MINCAKCGARNFISAFACWRCGKKLKAEDLATSSYASSSSVDDAATVFDLTLSSIPEENL